MTLPIERTLLSVRTTEPRMTPLPAGRRFAEALAQGGRAMLQGAVSALGFVPGGNALSAAVRGAVGPMVGPSGTPMSGSAESPGPGPVGSPTGTGSSGGSDPTGDDMLTRGQEMSMRMLHLQEAMGEENRRFTALSNVLHARHEMAKNAIGNIR